MNTMLLPVRATSLLAFAEALENLGESQREYQRIYHNNLYKNNPEFRKKQIERSKKK